MNRCFFILHQMYQAVVKAAPSFPHIKGPGSFVPCTCWDLLHWLNALLSRRLFWHDALELIGSLRVSLALLWHLGMEGGTGWDSLTLKAQKYVCGLKGRRGSDAESRSPVPPCQGGMFHMTEAMFTEPGVLRNLSENCNCIH